LRKSAETKKADSDDGGSGDEEYSDADDFDDEVFLDDDEYEDAQDCFNQIMDSGEKGKIAGYLEYYKKFHGADSAAVCHVFAFISILGFFEVPRVIIFSFHEF
jgi:hypothetical protein